jgi:acyl-coenzyme A synthetase/AMP-(fatty) acid ligase
MNIVNPILFQCKRQPSAAAICVPGPGIGRISYQRLERFVHNITRKLHAFGMPERSIVAVNIEDVIFHAAVLLSLTRLGMITLSLAESSVSVPIKIDALITTATATTPSVNIGGIIPAELSWTEGDGQSLETQLLPQTHEDDFCRIILTSGTTGEPKAVAISHKLLAKRMGRHSSVFGNRLGTCSRIYSDFPISSSLGFQFLIQTLWCGGIAFFPGDDFAATLRAFEDYKVQCLVGSPGGFETLLRWFDSVPSYQSSIEVIFCGGDVLSRSLSDRLRARICSNIIVAYGSTEASMSATAHAHEIADVSQAVGFVTPGVTVQIVDTAGTILPAGQEGRVRVRSEYAVDGYFRNTAGTSERFHDGWFFPGDLGVLQSDGLLVISGREKAVLSLGGDKLSPEKIELILSQFKGVIESAAFSAPNEVGNHEICAIIVSREKLDEQMLHAHCAARIPPSFVPVKYYFADRLPHNEMGKIDRQRLKGVVDDIIGRKSR